MKQTIITFAALLIFAIFSYSAQAQNVTLFVNGQNMQVPAYQKVIVPGVGEITAAEAVQYYPQPQQPRNLPAPSGNYGGNQMSQYNTQTAMADNALGLEGKEINNEIGRQTIKDMKHNRARGWVKTGIEGGREVVGAINETRQTSGNLDVQSAAAYLLRKQADCIGCGTTNPGYNPTGNTNNQNQYYNGQNVNGSMYYNGQFYVVYDNNEGPQGNGPYITMNNGQTRIYLRSLNIAWNGPLNYKYAGNWAQNNNYQAPNPNYQYQQQPAYNPYQQAGYYPQQTVYNPQQNSQTYTSGYPTQVNAQQNSFGHNWNPYTNTQE
jgi:hypothetical protein